MKDCANCVKSISLVTVRVYPTKLGLFFLILNVSIMGVYSLMVVHRLLILTQRCVDATVGKLVESRVYIQLQPSTSIDTILKMACQIT